MSEAPGIGDNSGVITLNKTAQGQLRSILERIERLEAEKGEIVEAIKEVKSEAKGNGFDTKIITKLVALRKKDRAKVQEENALLLLYATATGDIDFV